MLKASLAILTLLLLLGISAAILNWARRPTRREFASTNEKMAWLASEAVDIADKDYGVKLDYSEDSIGDVESILSNLHDEYCQTQSTVGLQGLATAFGSYIGEVIRRQHPGAHWERDHPIMGKDSYPIHWRDGQSFPLQWCYKRILNGPEENVWHKYLFLTEHHDALDGAIRPLVDESP